MTDTAFGDIEPDDAWDADPTIAPEQVTYRFHRLRRDFEALAGSDIPTFEELDADEQELALALGEAIVDWIENRTGDDPMEIARNLHGALVYISRGMIPDWDALGDELREVGTLLVGRILEWLSREGPR